MKHTHTVHSTSAIIVTFCALLIFSFDRFCKTALEHLSTDAALVRTVRCQARVNVGPCQKKMPANQTAGKEKKRAVTIKTNCWKS